MVKSKHVRENDSGAREAPKSRKSDPMWEAEPPVDAALLAADDGPDDDEPDEDSNVKE
jgi:hypothetical protein